MDDSAIAPSARTLMFQSINKSQNEVFNNLMTEDEEVWGAFAESPFYPRLKKHIENLIQGLDNAEDREFESGASMEQIGLRRMINKLTAANLKSILIKVEKTGDILRERRGQK